MDAIGFLGGFLRRIDCYTVIGEHIGAGFLVRCRLCIGQNAVSTHLGLLVCPALTHTVIASGQLLGILDSRLRIIGPGFDFHRGVLFGQKQTDGLTEGVHGLAVLGEPVHDIAMVRSDALAVTFGVADDVLLGQTIEFAQIGRENADFCIQKRSNRDNDAKLK